MTTTYVDLVTRLAQDRPVFHAGGKRRWDALPETLSTIARVVTSGNRTIETGCGASTVLFAAGGAAHTCISPDADEHARVRAYCDRVGVDHRGVTFVVGLSDAVLPTICDKRQYDVVFIDGAHAFPYPAVDWHYLSRALKVGGLMLLDDIPIPAVAAVFRYVVTDPSWEVERVLDGRTASLRLLAEPAPEDWTLQAYNRWPDYSFAPPVQRLRLMASSEVQRLRRAVPRDHPLLGAALMRLAKATRAR